MGRYASRLVAVLPELFSDREYWMCSRRELRRSVRLRLVWDFLLELCRREQGVLMGTGGARPGQNTARI